MMTMHEDQLDLEAGVAKRLIIALLPHISDLKIRRLDTPATTSHIFRVGSELTARFPLRRADAREAHLSLVAEHRAMEEFADHCPFPAPRPMAIGASSPAFPMPWSIQTWVPGSPATPSSLEASERFAHDLADLITALRAVETRGRTFGGEGRGGSLADHDDWVQFCLERSERLLPVSRLATMWEAWRTLEAPGSLTMSHRDLIPANLLTDGHRLVGVLDTGGFSAADPALDLVAAWHLLDRTRRSILRDRLASSDIEWERGAAWAFVQAIGLVWYYNVSNASMAQLGSSTLQRLLSSFSPS
jgi:aminoglycoside phosphotransferase (APT) family kinase protein